VVRDPQGQVVLDRFGQAKLRHGDEEVRESQEPFPLWPGERVKAGIQPLQIVEVNTALRLQAVRDFEDVIEVPARDEKSKAQQVRVARHAGEEWLFLGPQTYHPSPSVRVVHTIKAHVLQPGEGA
jgi:major vault protein